MIDCRLAAASCHRGPSKSGFRARTRTHTSMSAGAIKAYANAVGAGKGIVVGLCVEVVDVVVGLGGELDRRRLHLHEREDVGHRVRHELVQHVEAQRLRPCRVRRDCPLYAVSTLCARVTCSRPQAGAAQSTCATASSDRCASAAAAAAASLRRRRCGRSDVSNAQRAAPTNQSRLKSAALRRTSASRMNRCSRWCSTRRDAIAVYLCRAEPSAADRSECQCRPWRRAARLIPASHARHSRSC
jgi:hypothetical protein